MLDLDRGVADHFQKLLMRPDVILARGDVEIPDHDRAFRAFLMEHVAHLGQEIELLAEFLV